MVGGLGCPLVWQARPFFLPSCEVASSPGLLIGGRGEGERRPGIHCMRMHYVFRVFYRKSVRKCIQTVSVRNRIIQNLNNNGACAHSGYQAFFSPPPPIRRPEDEATCEGEGSSKGHF